MTDLQQPNVSHTGMVVPDLDRAMREYGKALECEWAYLNHYRSALQIGGRLVVHEWRSTYSVGGEHHVELTQQIEGIFFTHPGLGLARSHHVGRWVEDLESEVSRLEADGFVPLMTGCERIGHYEHMVFLAHPSVGIAVELLDIAMKPRLEAWLGGGASLSNVHSH